MPIPPLKDMLNGIGVFGQGTNFGVSAEGHTGVRALGASIGVRAVGTDHTGVRAEGATFGVVGSSASPQGRGGFFGSSHQAQVHLEPQERPTTPLPPAPYTPKAFPTVDPDPAELPVHGLPGDLLATTREMNDGSRRATLWFCARGRENVQKPALWREVLMGDEFPGTVG